MTIHDGIRWAGPVLAPHLQQLAEQLGILPPKDAKPPEQNPGEMPAPPVPVKPPVAGPVQPPKPPVAPQPPVELKPVELLKVEGDPNKMVAHYRLKIRV